MDTRLELGQVLVRWAEPASLIAKTGTPEGLLSAEERLAARRFHVPADTAAYVAAHALLRSTLSELLRRAPQELRFVTGRHGKPELDPSIAGDLRISLSHTRGCVACAVTPIARVGVDVEDAVRDIDVLGVASRTCTASESARLAELPPARRIEAFLRSWTLKEAMLKALGSGLSGPLEELEFDGLGGSDAPSRIALRVAPIAIEEKSRWHFEQRRLLNRYVMAVALAPVEGAEPRVEVREVRLL